MTMPQLPGLIDQKYLNKLANDIIDESLEFCPCIDPAQTLLYIMKGLDLIELRETYLNEAESPAQENVCRKICEERELAFFGSEGAQAYFFQTMYRDMFTEHDHVLPGTLTENGHELLKKLHEWNTAREEFNAPLPF